MPIVWLLLAALLFIGMQFKRNNLPRLRPGYAIASALLFLVATGALLSGCAGKPTAVQDLGTPPGQYAIVVTATSGTFSQPVTVNLTVTAH